MKLKIISWNIWAGRYLEKIISFLEEQNADIICLQEVIQNIDGSENVAQIIAEKLGYEWVYNTTAEFNLSLLFSAPDKEIAWGNAILSKYKITGHAVHVLSEDQKRTALEANISVNDVNMGENKVVNIFSTHLLHTHHEVQSDIQDMQAKKLVDIASQKNKTIVAGDFNNNPQSNPVHILQSKMVSADTNLDVPSWSAYEDGCSVCKPKKNLCRLDYIFTTKDIVTLDARVENSDGADHLPVSAIVEV